MKDSLEDNLCGVKVNLQQRHGWIWALDLPAHLALATDSYRRATRHRLLWTVEEDTVEEVVASDGGQDAGRDTCDGTSHEPTPVPADRSDQPGPQGKEHGRLVAAPEDDAQPIRAQLQDPGDRASDSDVWTVVEASLDPTFVR